MPKGLLAGVEGGVGGGLGGGEVVEELGADGGHEGPQPVLLLHGGDEFVPARAGGVRGGDDGGGVAGDAVDLNLLAA